MTEFGDATPEDAWDPDDALDELIDNLSRRLDLLDEPRRGDADGYGAAIEQLRDRLNRASARGGDLDERQLQRVRMIADDLAHVSGRFDAGRLRSEH